MRVNRLENQIRQLSGQIEQLQFENRRLADQLRRFQEDVEFRLGQGQGGQRPAAAPGQPAQPQAGQQPQRAAAERRLRSGRPADEPGAPRTLGQAEQGGGGPVDLNAGGRPNQQASAAPAATRQGYDARSPRSTPANTPAAEAGFRDFIQANPRSRLVPAATYQLGESYFRRSQHREAAEQFLKVTTESASRASRRTRCLRLGMSLAALGAREQACATFARLGQRYPSASETVRNGVTREQRRARCDG